MDQDRYRIDEPEFYKEEIRYDFTVSPARKKVWAKELEILLEFDRICRENGLTYYLACGTLLGAVRHHGFIPWDDDIDVEMFRPDYERAKEIFERELKAPFEWQDTYTIVRDASPEDGGMLRFLPFAKIRNSDTAAIERTGAPASMNQGIYIDVFPLDDAMDGVGFNAEMLEIQREMYGLVFAEDALAEALKDMNRKTAVPREQLMAMLGMPFVDRFRIYESMLVAFAGKSGYVNYKGYELRGSIPNYPKKWYGEPAMLDFEGYTFPAPGCWHEYLEARYHDYMNPVSYGGHQVAIFDTEHSYRDFFDESGQYTGPSMDEKEQL